MAYAGNNEQISVSKATSTLISLILQMPPREIIETLNDLQRKHKNNQNRSRANTRPEVVFAIGKRVYKGIASTIRPQGMFIETFETFKAGDSLSLSFECEDLGRQIKTTGRVSSIVQNGIGVEFDSEIDTALNN